MSIMLKRGYFDLKNEWLHVLPKEFALEIYLTSLQHGRDI